MLLQSKQIICCEFSKVAANLYKELLRIKRMLLQIKSSKVCARIEGGRSEYKDFFEREAVPSFFFLGSCVRTNFLKCFAVRAVGNAPKPSRHSAPSGNVAVQRIDCIRANWPTSANK